ncbi:MAG: hypothetical protein A3F89_04625 [Deltaproteobacteria bacterium RIFCSPLOWO2_12_FULL_50_11]|nr:MAG: hypothetical protein A3F89_04625 [Deltaproteobacteria bacterium RIFCSPLOWO2_12_FULL_50_11]
MQFFKKYLLFSTTILLGMIVWWSPVTASFQYATYSITGDGFLALEDTHTGNVIHIQYKNEGEPDLAALEKISEFLRCRKTGQIIHMDIALIHLIDHLEDHFRAEKVEVVSGYRSPQLNSQLRREGRRVARHSLHMKGQAVDIFLPGTSNRVLRNYVLALQTGGVGYYPRGGFVHVDTGPVRSW